MSNRTAWGPVCEGTPREDPRMSKGASGQHGGLCVRGHQGRIPGCSRDSPDSIGRGLCVRGHQGRIPGCPRDSPDCHVPQCASLATPLVSMSLFP